MISCNKKQIIRKELRAIRKNIPHERRLNAQEALLATLYPRLAAFRSILSFHSLPCEIDMSVLNQTLSTEMRLLLPKVEGVQLDCFHVTHVSNQLKYGAWNCFEPISEACELASLERIDCVLVPALGFDAAHMRIGYGKGFYDRFIAHAKIHAFKMHFIGVGFQEQLCARALPIEAHDQSLDELILV